MLDVIVLGHVPGTNLQITFTWVLFLALVAVIWFDIKLHRDHQPASKKKPSSRQA